MKHNKNIEERLDRIERMVIIAGKEVLNVAECALMLNKSESRIRHMVSERLIPYYKVGSRTMFRKSEIESQMLQRENRIPTIAEIQSQAAIRVAVKK
jgi:hypothetical protein